MIDWIIRQYISYLRSQFALRCEFVPIPARIAFFCRSIQEHPCLFLAARAAPTSSYKFQLPHGRQGHQGRHGHVGHVGRGELGGHGGHGGQDRTGQDKTDI